MCSCVFCLSDVESSLRVTRCKQMVESLPEHHYIVAEYLLSFLHMVSLININAITFHKASLVIFILQRETLLKLKEQTTTGK